MAETVGKVADDQDAVSPSEIFRRLWQSFYATEKGEKPILSAEECVATCKRLIPTLDWLNDEGRGSSLSHDDLTTGELELTALPCILAFFEDKLPVKEASQRKEILPRIILLYKFYLSSFHQLHLPLPDGSKDADEDLEDSQSAKSPEAIRNKAISNFQWQRTLFARIEAQSSYEEDSESGRRQRASDILFYWVYRSRREIELASKELKLLSAMSAASRESASAGPQPSQSLAQSQVLSGVALPYFDVNINNVRNVRQNLRQQVFGLGYPSAPVLTAEQWFEQKQVDDARHRHEHPPPPPPRQRREGEDTSSDEEEDKRQSAIRFDSFKDDHRKGEGNTYRRG